MKFPEARVVTGVLDGNYFQFTVPHRFTRPAAETVFRVGCGAAGRPGQDATPKLLAYLRSLSKATEAEALRNDGNFCIIRPPTVGGGRL